MKFCLTILVALEVIQEMAVVDEFGGDRSILSRDVGITTKSVIETRPLGSPIRRRVVSANNPRLHPDIINKRIHSASASMAVVDSSSVGREQV